MEKLIEQKESENQNIYVYGLTDKLVDLKIKGLKDKPIKRVYFKDIIALTSDYPDLHPLLKEDEAMQHAEILKEISKKTNVIPMSFGAVFKNQKILETVLSKAYQTIKNTFSLINHKIELGIKVVKDQSYIPNGEAKEILETLDKLSVKSVKGDNFSERLLLNNSFLVNKNNFSKFSKAVAGLEKKYLNLKFIYTGPWPPYSFVDIRINRN